MPDRLPRGPHGLSREEVVRSQRTRILRGMAETMAEKGYVATTVADVLRAAGVSRETFYQQFNSKADCFMAAYDEAVAVILPAIGGAGAGGAGDDAASRFDRGVTAYLDALAAEPAFARLFLVEVYAAGPEAIERRAQAQARFVDVLAAVLEPRDATERFAVELLVAGVSAMVTARLAAGDTEGLQALHEPLTALVRRALQAQPSTK